MIFNVVNMPFFSIKQGKLVKIKGTSFRNEKEIQIITEQNLKDIFGLEFVKSEISIGNLRIDTLAFDNETKSFVIIEYKKDKNFSVIDQGFAYLSLLLNNKADIIIEYNECKNKSLKRVDVDWSQTRVIFISPQFTKYQRQAINIKDLPIELWEISKFENNTILFNQIKPFETSESITKISSRSDIVQKVSREIKVYTEEDHLQGIPEEIVETYLELKERILNLGDNVDIRPRKLYIGFIANTNFVDIRLQKAQIKIWINLAIGELDDPKKLAMDVSKKGHWGNGDYEIILKPGSDLDYLMTLIKQSYKKHSI
jgi:predicted transport protein